MWRGCWSMPLGRLFLGWVESMDGWITRLFVRSINSPEMDEPDWLSQEKVMRAATLCIQGRKWRRYSGLGTAPHYQIDSVPFLNGDQLRTPKFGHKKAIVALALSLV